MTREDIETNRMTKAELLAKADWAETAAEKVLEVFPDNELYTVAAGISPSGVVHFGNMRDVMTAHAVSEALKAKGKKTRFLFSWDDYDRFRKVPVGVPDSYKEHLGKPLVDIPDPAGEFDSYAERFEKAFQEAMEELGIELDYVSQSEMYRSGAYKEAVIHALKNREAIARLLLSFMSDKAKASKEIDEDQYAADFYPVLVYSRFTGKDTTTVLDFDGESKLTYKCKETGKEEVLDLNVDFNVKLPWKIDWPMRWRHENVVFEPGGKDHSTPGGSYDTSATIGTEVFDIEAPVFVGYDFIGIQGLEGKMSSSAGNSVSPGQLLEIYIPELLIWIYERTSPNRPFNLAFDKDIYRQYDEFDRLDPKEGSEAPIPFRQAVGFGQIVSWDVDRMQELLEGNHTPYSRESLEARLPKAKAWLETYNQEEMIVLNEDKNADYSNQIPEDEKEELAEFLEALKKGQRSIDEWTTLVYAIPKTRSKTEEEQKARQKKFYKNVYQLLFSKDRGPRLGTYLWASNLEKLVELLEV